MKRFFNIIFFGFIAVFSLFFVEPSFVFAQNNNPDIHFFYSAVCPNCSEGRKFLQDLKKEFPEIEIKEYEVVSSVENQQILAGFFEKYQVPEKDRGWVPITFTSHDYFIGFDKQVGQKIRSCIETCIGDKNVSDQKIKVPFLGEVNISQMSLPVLTIVLGSLDGLNPCAMWVLLFLIAILVNTRSKKRIWLIGGTFILASGIVYFLILSAWLNLFLLISYVNLTRILIGLFALAVGVWQIKNFATSTPGVCRVLGISSKIEEKLKLKERTEGIATAPITIGIIGGLIFLALGVNLIEFFCSAGLPAIYTRTLTLSGVGTFEHYLYLLFYVFIFMLDDLIIFSIAAFTLKQVDFTGKYAYWATLIGGMLIFVLGVLLIFKPAWLMFG